MDGRGEMLAGRHSLTDASEPRGAANAGNRRIGAMNVYIRAVTAMSRLAGVIGAFLIAFAVLVICDMVIERYILGRTTIWQIDVVTYSIMGPSSAAPTCR